ncbi:MAG: FAD-binding oxidoreductase [Bryobacteraceae bacterium]|jgi:ferredoxin--NADP+ reductase
MNLSEYDISNRYTAMLLSSQRITPPDSDAEVRHLVMQLPVKPLEYREGQSIGVLVPGPHEFGNRQHLRLYSIANSRKGEGGRGKTISICVRRCFYIDEISGERYPGKASNYLCDAQPGDPIQITGPYGLAFNVPEDPTANLLMVGAGTGIAPFRAFTRHIYEEKGGWQGDVRLFYGAKTGLDMLYMNDVNKDFALYYEKENFKAFEALSPRPAFNAPPDLEHVLAENSFDVWDMLQKPNTYVYIAGLMDAARNFEKAMIVRAGSEGAWFGKLAELMEEKRYAEVLYE